MKKITYLLFFLCLSANAQWLTSFEDAQKLAIATNKNILIDFWATWCGPCKRMDSDSWSKSEVKELMNNYIPLKIDIDLYREISDKYDVKAIPYVFIVDPNGKVVFKNLSYMNKAKIMTVLNKYSYNTKYFQDDFLNFYKSKNGDLALKIAQKYFDYSIYVKEEVQSDYLKVANDYLKEASKFYKKEGNKKKNAQRIGLLEDVYDNILRGNNEKANDIIEKKYAEEKINSDNKSFYVYLRLAIYEKQNDKENAKVWYDKMKLMEGYRTEYLKIRKI
jgi:thiol-disulfide isomerase/thioredoxin